MSSPRAMDRTKPEHSLKPLCDMTNAGIPCPGRWAPFPVEREENHENFFHEIAPGS